MKKLQVTATATLYKNVSELSEEDQLLMQKAVEARANAYAPYSKFSVGAALLLANNQIILGSNQENAAYPSGMCAERVAVWKAGTAFPGVAIKKLAITASSANYTVEKPVGPCGACRQTLSEYEVNQKEPMQILFMGEVGKIVKTESLGDLLPFSFDSSYL